MLSSWTWTHAEIISGLALFVSIVSTTVAVLVYWRGKRAVKPVAYLRSSRVKGDNIVYKVWWFVKFVIQNNASYPLQLNKVTIVAPTEAKFLDWDFYDGDRNGYNLPMHLQNKAWLDSLEFEGFTIPSRQEVEFGRYLLGYRPRRVKFIIFATLLSPKPRRTKLKLYGDLSTRPIPGI